MRIRENLMASFRSLRTVALLVIAAFFTVPSFGETSAFRVDESQIRFRLSPHPVVEIPVVNASGKALPGNFKLELLDTDDSVESVVTGTFPGSSGTSVEKIAWPEDAKARGSLSRFGWHRLRYSFAPLAESGIPPFQGVVQLNRVLAGVIRVRIAAASKAKPGSRYRQASRREFRERRPFRSLCSRPGSASTSPRHYSGNRR